MGPTDIQKISGSSCVLCTSNAYLNGLDNFSPDGYVTCEQCCNLCKLNQSKQYMISF